MSLKRKGSQLTRGSLCKQSRFDMPFIVSKPSDEADLRQSNKARLEDLCDAMEIDKADFLRLISHLRDLAALMDIDLSTLQEDGDKWKKFVAEACKQQPIWGENYEDSWPIATYMYRYLYHRAAYKARAAGSKMLTYKPPVSSADDTSNNENTVATTPNFVPIPTNELQLRDSSKRSLDYLQMATGFGDEDFERMKHELRRLAKQYLDIDLPFDKQSHDQWQLLVQEACTTEPLSTVKFENSWPVSVYLDRYLSNRLCKKTRQGLLARSVPPRAPSSRVESGHQKSSQRVCPAETTTLPPASAADLPPNYSSVQHLPIAVDASSESMSVNDKENVPQPATSVSDPSVPVREFLRHLGQDFEILLPIFVNKGVKDGETLSVFKRMSGECKAVLLMTWRELDDFQLVRLQLALRDWSINCTPPLVENAPDPLS